MREPFRLGPWTIYPSTGEIAAADAETRRVEPKVIEVLLQLVERAPGVGATATMTKPVDMEELLVTVSDLLEQST